MHMGPSVPEVGVVMQDSGAVKRTNKTNKECIHLQFCGMYSGVAVRSSIHSSENMSQVSSYGTW